MISVKDYVWDSTIYIFLFRILFPVLLLYALIVFKYAFNKTLVSISLLLVFIYGVIPSYMTAYFTDVKEIYTVVVIEVMYITATALNL